MALWTYSWAGKPRALGYRDISCGPLTPTYPPSYGLAIAKAIASQDHTWHGTATSLGVLTPDSSQSQLAVGSVELAPLGEGRGAWA